MKIKDRLRNLKYVLEKVEKSEDNEIIVKSKMKFIEITAGVSTKLDNEIVTDWFQMIANRLECVTQLNEIALTYLTTYPKEKIKQKPDEDDKRFLDLLFNSPLILPTSNEKSIDVFNKQRGKLFSNLTLVDYSDYFCILELCLNNDSKTLLIVYDEICHKMKLSYFLWATYELSSKALINLLKLEFNDIPD